MKSGKLKNIILIILALADIFLLLLAVPMVIQLRSTEQEVRQRLCAVMNENGILLEEEVISGDASLYVLAPGRSIEREESAARLLLGDVQVSDLGGGIFAYAGPGGTVTFRGGGEFSGELSPSRQGEFPRSGVQRLLKELGIDVLSVREEWEGEGRYVVTAAQRVEKARLFSGEIVLVYNETGLESLSGRRYDADELEIIGELRGSCATALMEFLNSREQLGFVCREIMSVTAGYVRSDSGAERRLAPVWRIVTDTGEFQVDFQSLGVTQIS